MDFRINNRYWLNMFVRDFLETEKRIFEWKGARILSIDEFKDRYVYTNHTGEREEKYFELIIGKYNQCLSNSIIITKRNIEKFDIAMDFFEYKKKCDKENKIGLKDVKFDLIDLSEGIHSSGQHYYLIACDIDSSINFELIYGTLKILNVI